MAPMPRSATTRAQTARPTFNPKNRRDIDPSAIPSNEEWQWKREATLGQPDDGNIETHLVAGWAPVTLEDYPSFMRVSLPGRQASDNLIRSQGLILMKRPKEIGDAERAEYAAINRQILASVDKDRRASVHGAGVRADDPAFEGVRSTIDNGRFPDA